MLAVPLVAAICIINALALVLYRARMVGNRPAGFGTSYSVDLFSLPSAGATVLLFNHWPVTVRRQFIWNALAFWLFPSEVTINETSCVVRFTYWFAEQESGWCDVTYVMLATVLFPLKAIWNIGVIVLIGLVRGYFNSSSA